MSKVAALLAAVVLFSSCKDGGLPGRICTTEARAGIEVDVRDALTGEPAAEGAIGIAQDGLFVDTLSVFPTLPPQGALTMVGAFERPGIYTVVVRKPGYREWTQANVVVSKDECHVITTRLQARLERGP